MQTDVNFDTQVKTPLSACISEKFNPPHFVNGFDERWSLFHFWCRHLQPKLSHNNHHDTQISQRVIG